MPSKKKTKATPPSSDKESPTRKNRKAEGAVASAPGIRFYKRSGDKTGHTLLWIIVPATLAGKFKDRKKYGSLSASAREAMKTLPKAVPKIPALVNPVVRQAITIPDADRKRIEAFVEAGNDLDAYVTSHLEKKVSA